MLSILVNHPAIEHSHYSSAALSPAPCLPQCYHNQIFADPYSKLPAITYWLMGSLAAVNLSDAKIAAFWTLLGMIPLALLRWRINVLSLGDEEAKALGVDTGKIRGVVIVVATLMTATVVSISGIIGWAGLVVPQLARMLV